MTNTIARPFVVRELRGRFVPTFSTDTGEWMAAGAVRLQVNGPNGKTMLVPVAADGSFDGPRVAAGRYCFHSAASEFQGYEGVIVVDPSAPAEDMVIVRVDLGV